ncbi:adiponectin receptor [Brevipalpus obovatus]|uniref:adiponectin receptor n=1 Tax=Brevipalpus obovatus TaxID=246614 RepID=UPI003D9DEF4A
MRWSVCHFNHLPKWLQDNEYLITGHRPPLRSFRACFWSIFRQHTETINIWTHMLGCFLFLCLWIYFHFVYETLFTWLDKLVFGAFFMGAILCLGFSFAYHMLSCHSPQVGKLFSKLDYCGIALLITGSFIPWLYYGFYCETELRLWYTGVVTVLCGLTILVSLWDNFSEPHLRPLRAGVFALFGLSGIFPGFHWLAKQNWFSDVSLRISFGCLVLMGVLYLTGALLYACRVPERFFPGKCDIWFHSHQLFHILVIAAAIVHYRGISELALHRFNTLQTCMIPTKDMP